MDNTWRADTGPFSLLKRATSTLLLARGIHKRVKKLERELEDASDSDEDERAERWEQLHQANARATYHHIITYKGFLAKVGQGLSATDGNIPQPYKEEFKALQDHLPVSSFDEVQRVVRAELGRPLAQIFSSFDELPLASATVGQAHAAVVKESGRKVCVKVQHDGVSRMMSVDLSCIEYIARQALKQHKEAPDITPIIREWKRASRDEVDFRLEAANARRAGETLAAHHVDVGCPSPIDGLCSARILTMEFIDGFKATEVERLPKGADVAALASQILEAFAVLTFRAGLIHGDPHPGNIFFEPVDGGSRVRPVLLDWGIAKLMTPEESLHTARWVVATMTQDSALFLSAGRGLGYVFTDHVETQAVDRWMKASVFMFRDSLPASAQSYLHDMLDERRDEQREKEKRDKEQSEAPAQKASRPGCRPCSKGRKKRNGRKKAVETIPGTLLFFSRAVHFLQGLCSTLNVSIPFAKPLLNQALALLASSQTIPLAIGPVPAPSLADQAPRCASLPNGHSDLERAVLALLEEHGRDRRSSSAQVSVYLDGTPAAPDGSWPCDMSFGSAGAAHGPIASTTLMPMLETGASVLVLCLLSVLGSGPMPSGGRANLETPVGQLWPEFSQQGKKSVTVGELLQRTASLSRPFPLKKAGLARFCNERRMEEALAAASPGDEDFDDVECPRLAIAAAALLRRMTGHQTAAAALRSILEPLGLHEDIVFFGEESRMAWMIRKPIESLPLSRVFEWLEHEKSRAGILSDHALERPQWLTWDELAVESPACADPLLPNSAELRSGKSFCAARGLRATARALCRLYAADLVAPELRERCVSSRRRLRVRSLEDWQRAGRCLDFGIGWQIFRFRQLDATKQDEVIGYGHADGETGSVVLRIPNVASVAVMLSSLHALDEDRQQFGFEVLRTIAAHIGLEPVWHLEIPDLPEIPPAPSSKNKSPDGWDELQAALAGVQAEVARLSQKLEDGLPAAGATQAITDGADGKADDQPLPMAELAGEWRSAEIQNLEAVLSALNVPSTFHFLARQAERTLRVEISSGRPSGSGTVEVSIVASTSLKGRSVDDGAIRFEVGRPFEGRQKLGGSFRGMAQFGVAPAEHHAESAGADEQRPALLVEKRFSIDGREVVLGEVFFLEGSGRLVVSTTCTGLAEGAVGEPLESKIIYRRIGNPPVGNVRPESSIPIKSVASPSDTTIPGQLQEWKMSRSDDDTVEPGSPTVEDCMISPVLCRLPLGLCSVTVSL